MILAWFDARRVEEFGTSLAAYFIERVPRDQEIEDKKIAARNLRKR